MKKTLALTVLVLGMSSAIAQQQCWPKPFGDGTTYNLIRAEKGYIVAWYCNTGYAWNLNYLAALDTWLTTDKVVELSKVLTASDFRAAADAAWAKNVTLKLDPQIQLDIMIDYPAPLAPRWTVAKNSAYTSRPTYPIIDGKRGATSVGRIDVGFVCDCADPKKRFVESTSTYCGVAAGQVALCKAE